MTVLHDNLGNPIDASNPLPVDINTSEAIQPTDIQSHLQSTIQTHNAVSVALNSWSTESVWHDADGFDKIACTLLDDSGSVTNGVNIYWSNDGSSIHAVENLIAQSTGANRAGIVDTKARYFKLTIYNGDGAAAHTMSAWAFLKA